MLRHVVSTLFRNTLALTAAVPAVAVLALAVLTLAGPLDAQLSVELTTVAGGFERPVAVIHAGDDRLFVIEQAGLIRIVDEGVVQPQPYLDIRSRVSFDPAPAGEEGLLGAAFHPDYASTGYLFVTYLDAAGDSVIARYQVRADDPQRADPATERILLRVPQPGPNHNVGQLQFGPDGFLYIAAGDGGYLQDPRCSGQETDHLLGKLSRIDVDTNAETPPYYAIPPSNPFVGVSGTRDEIWALGLRNPWRFSFDRSTGDLYLADVGQNVREEINVVASGAPGGDNFGFKMMEGNLCLGSSSRCPATVPACGSSAYTAPAFDYGHDGEHCAVIGGYVYRGSQLPELFGSYVFGDYCGALHVARQVGDSWQVDRLQGFSQFGVITFGERFDGELLLLLGDSLMQVADVEPVGGGTCNADNDTLCLQDGRFQVEVSWRSADGNGQGQAIKLDGGAGGYFWFFDPANPELFVKVLDACSNFGRYWVFAAGLTDVETQLTVLDHETGEVRQYDTALGQGFEAIRDTDGFATCP